MNKPHKHADLLMRYAKDSAKIDEPWLLYEWKTPCGNWSKKSPNSGFLIHENYRRKPNADELLADMLKPKLKPVDMSVLIGSGVDCSFIDNYDAPNMIYTYSPLLSISADGRYCRSVGQIGWKQCKPRLAHWHTTLNADSPKIVSRLSGAGFDLRLSSSVYDNRSFQIMGLRDGYCWPWELEE